MQINRLSVENFRVLSGSREWEFPNGIIGLTGPNGTGKSTLANSIAWALFGPEVLPTGKADVVTWGAKEASVTVEFALQGETFVASRWQKANGSSGASLWHGDEQIADGLDPTTREVGRLLGVDRVGFLVSVFSRQEELAGLSSLTAANRVKTILRLLGISVVNSAIDKVRDEARVKKRELEALRLSTFDFTEAKKRVKELVTEIASSESQATLLADERKTLETELATLTRELAQTRVRQREYETFVRADTELVTRINQASVALRNRLMELDRMSPPPDPGKRPESVDYATFVSAGTEEKTAKELLETLVASRTKGVCPTCGQTLPHFDPTLDSQIETATGRHESAVEALASVRGSVESAEAWQRRAEATDGWLRAREAARRDVWLAQDEYHHASRERNRLPVVAAPDLDGAEEQIEERRERLAQVREYISYLTAKTKADSAERDRLTKRLAETSGHDGSLDKAEKAVLTHDVAVRELTAWKETLVTEAIPTLTEIASGLIGELTDGAFTELTITPNYEIQYRNALGELKTFENLSGGEQDIFALALRLAIAELQSENIGVLFLDEILESLDEDRQDLAWKVLERLTKRYQQIFVVTHVERFKDRAIAPISLEA